GGTGPGLRAGGKPVPIPDRGRGLAFRDHALPAAARAFGPRFRTFETPAAGMAFRTSLIASFGEDFESQRARDRRGLDQLHGRGVAQPVAFTGVIADQRVACLVVAEIVVAERACRDESISACFVELHEQARPRDAADPALEACADTVGQEIR